MAWWVVAAAAVSAYSNIMGARAAADAMRQQANQAELQGEIAVIQSEFQARMQLKAGREQADYIRDKSAEMVGTRVTQAGASGVEISGSPMMVIANEIWAGEQAAASALKNSNARAGQIEAEGYGARAQANAQAAGLRGQAGITEQAGWLKAVATAVSAYATHQYYTGGAAPGTAPAYGAPERGSPYYTSFSE